MEALVEVMEAEKLVPLFDIPAAMRHEQVQVIILPLQNGKTSEDEKPAEKPKVNMEILNKFREHAESGASREQLRKKLEEGVIFEFDAQKIIDGLMTESDWQKLYALEKRR